MERISLRELMLLGAKGAGGDVDYISGTFTVPSNATNYKFEFGKTISSYLFLIEATEESKTEIVNSESTNARAYVWFGTYPVTVIDNKNTANCFFANRIQPSTEAISNGAMSNSAMSDTGISFTVVGMTDSGWGSLVKGLSYNYYVAEIK